jgi:Protein of unknown function (DUF1360)
MDGYSPPDDHKPLGGYAVLSTAFNAAVATYVFAYAHSQRKLPSRIPLRDMLLMALATQRLSRLIAKDRVLSFARSPFTRYAGEGGPSEVSEQPRGGDVRRAVGELLVCPYCVGHWIGTAFLGAYLLRPRTTRVVASALSIVGVADLLQQFYVAVDKRA